MKVFKEQDVTVYGCEDDTDGKVKEIERKKAQTKEEVYTHLKSAEAQLSGEDILGTALVTPVRQKVTETVFEEDAERTRYKEFNIKWSHVPSGHAAEPVRISVSDPVFVHPASYQAVAEVLRQVGNIAGVSQYCLLSDGARVVNSNHGWISQQHCHLADPIPTYLHWLL